MATYLSFRNSLDGRGVVRQCVEYEKVTQGRNARGEDQDDVVPRAARNVGIPAVVVSPGPDDHPVSVPSVCLTSSSPCLEAGDKSTRTEHDAEVSDREDCLRRNSNCVESLKPKFKAGRRLSNIIDTAAQSQQFFQDLEKMRERAAEENKNREPVPVFNKRLFSAHGSVVITSEARRLMARNARVEPGEDIPLMDKSELHAMRCVVDGLRLIHRGQDHVKDALSHVISLESYSPYQYIVKRPYEAQLSCYYIIHGAVQVTYDMDITETRSVFQPNIIYNHGTGEFLGLVSADGISDDLSPPATVYTTEPCEFLRIDRKKFHEVVQRIKNLQQQEKLAFFNTPKNVLSSLPPEALDKVIEHVHKMEYPPNRVILQQGHTSEYLYFIFSGRCRITRDVYIPETDRQVCFFLDSREKDDFFGEECILESEGTSTCHVATSIHSTLLLLHRAALEVISKDSLLNVLECKRHYLPSEDELRDQGYRKSVWDGYKHREVRECLKEHGCLHILSRDLPEKVRARPPIQEYIQRENLLRFVLKGAGYERFSAGTRSARCVRSQPVHKRSLCVRARPCTALVTSKLGTSQVPVSEVVAPLSAEAKHKETPRPGTAVDGVDTIPDVAHSDGDILEGNSSTISFLRMLEKNLAKGLLQNILGSKGADVDLSALAKAAEENPEVARRLRLAWEIHLQDKQNDFTKTTVLVTMKTEDIVRKAKAKAMAEKQSFASTESDEDDADKEWRTCLHEENKLARRHIAGDKLRAAFLRRKINALRPRQKTLQPRVHQLRQSAKSVDLSSSEHKAIDKQQDGAGFYLDEIQKKYQGLDPLMAKHKMNSVAYEALFVSRLRCRSRSLHDLQDLQTDEAGHVKQAFRNRSARLNSDPEVLAMHRLRIQEVTMPPSQNHPLHIESTRKDVPIALKGSCYRGTKSDDSTVSMNTKFPRRASRETTLSIKTFMPPANAPFPKLQVNR